MKKIRKYLKLLKKYITSIKGNKLKVLLGILFLFVFAVITFLHMRGVSKVRSTLSKFSSKIEAKIEAGNNYTISISSNPEGAEVTAYRADESEIIGTTPFEWIVEKDNIDNIPDKLVFRINGYEEYTFEVDKESIAEEADIVFEMNPVIYNIDLKSKPEGVNVSACNADGCSDVGVTPFTWSVEELKVPNKLFFKLSGYHDHIIEIDRSVIPDSINVELEVNIGYDKNHHVYEDTVINWEEHYKFEFLPHFHSISMGKCISDDLKEIEYIDLDTGEKIGCFAEGDCGKEEWFDFNFSKNSRDFNLSLSDKLHEKIKESYSKSWYTVLTNRYWQQHLEILPSSYLIPTEVSDGESIKKVSNDSTGSYTYVLVGLEGKTYPLLKTINDLKSVKVAPGLFRILVDGFIYDIDLKVNTMKLFKYINLYKLNPEICRYSEISFDEGHLYYVYPNHGKDNYNERKLDIVDKSQYCNKYYYSQEGSYEVMLIKYSYINGSYNAAEVTVGSIVGRGPWPDDLLDTQVSQDGSTLMSINTWRDYNTLVVGDLNSSQVYESEDRIESFGQFLNDNEIIVARYFWYVCDDDSEECMNLQQPQLVKIDLTTKEETVLDSDYEYYNFKLNPDSSWGTFYGLSNIDKKDGSQIYAINIDSGEVKLLAEYGMYPYWIDNNTVRYQHIGPCTKFYDSSSGGCVYRESPEHCYCAFGELGHHITNVSLDYETRTVDVY